VTRSGSYNWLTAKPRKGASRSYKRGFTAGLKAGQASSVLQLALPMVMAGAMAYAGVEFGTKLTKRWKL